jgi:hypothetical protein
LTSIISVSGLGSRVLATAGVLCALSLTASHANAWTVQVHVDSANAVIQAVRYGDTPELELRGYGTFVVQADLAEAIRRHPAAYRGGAIGPDGYPDIYTGQAYTHTDQSAGLLQRLLDDGKTTCEAAVAEGWCDACDEANRSCVGAHDSLVPFPVNSNRAAELELSLRPKKYWRSIDWARQLLRDAQRELREAYDADSSYGIDEGYRALAFAAGYLLHFAGDAFAHNWVNLYVGGPWDYFDEHPEREYRHVAVERYAQYLLDEHELSGQDPQDYSIDAPDWFVSKYLMEEYVSGSDSAAPGAAHIRNLYAYRDLIQDLKEKLNPRLPPGTSILDSSGLWAYVLNVCIPGFGYETATGVDCPQTIYNAATLMYLEGRESAIDEAILGWVRTSTGILQDGFLSGQGADVGAIREHLQNYRTDYVTPLFVPTEDEPLGRFLALRCKDVGPPNFVAVCDALTARIQAVVATQRKLVETAMRDKFRVYLDAVETTICAVSAYTVYWTQPIQMLNAAFCDGEPSGCPLAEVRRTQLEDDAFGDVFLLDSVPQDDLVPQDEFLPYRNSIDLGLLTLLEQAELGRLALAANELDLGDVPPISSEASFLTSNLYENVLFESVASLDGTLPLYEDQLMDPRRVLFDQLRKEPVFALWADPSARFRVHFPLFEISRQDPDGDQIYLAYDRCPCLAQTRDDNERDGDANGIGDACDPMSLFVDTHRAFDRALGEVYTMLEFSGADSPPVTLSSSLQAQLFAAFEGCNDPGPGSVEALNRLALLGQSLEQLRTGGYVTPEQFAYLDQTLNLLLLSPLRDGYVHCSDLAAPGKVTSCWAR